MIITFPVFSQEKTCTIFGFAPGREGAVLGIYSYDDYITLTEIKLGETIVGDSGKFSVTFEAPEITKVMIRSQKLIGFLYAEPGRKIEVEFPERDPKAMVNPDVEYTTDVSIYTEDSTDMNFLASDFNRKFYKWWGQNYIHLVSKDSMMVLDSFAVRMKRHYHWVKNPYFKPWMEYGIAAMQDATLRSPLKSGTIYLTGRKIHYHNSEYMAFFNSFFKDYLYKWSLRKEGSGIMYAINEMISYDSLLGAMKNLPWMKNDSLREMVMLKGLFEVYDNPAFNSRNVLAIAQLASIRSPVAEHRRIARNIVSFYTWLKKGSAAPAFTTIDRKGAAVDPLLANRGKYIYLFFYSTTNPSSVSELRYSSGLQKKYGKSITFINVSVDADTLAWKKFLLANPKISGTMLHYDFKQKTKDDFKLYTVPAGFIIDPDGKFYLSPADNPSGDLEAAFAKIATLKGK